MAKDFELAKLAHYADVNIAANTAGITGMPVTNLGVSNKQTLDFGTYTTNAPLNTVIAGPYTIATGNTLVIATGSRVVII